MPKKHTPDVNLTVEYKGKTYSDAQASKLFHLLADRLEVAAKKPKEVFGLFLDRFVEDFINHLKTVHSVPYPMGTTVTTLSARTGHGVTRLRYRVAKSRNPTATIMIPAHLYGHEEPRTIRPHKAAFLTIPLPAAMRANGTVKRLKPSSWTNTFVMRSRRGNLLIVQRRGRGRVVPLYVLKKEVRIPARLGFQRRLDERKNLFMEEAGLELMNLFNSVFQVSRKLGRARSILDGSDDD